MTKQMIRMSAFTRAGAWSKSRRDYRCDEITDPVQFKEHRSSVAPARQSGTFAALERRPGYWLGRAAARIHFAQQSADVTEALEHYRMANEYEAKAINPIVVNRGLVIPPAQIGKKES